jgi:hypothetical protein
VIKKFKSVIFALALLCIVLFFTFHYLDKNSESLVSLYLFLTFWGLDKCLAWHLGEKIGIASMLAIPSDAHKNIRLLGLLIGLFLTFYGINHLFVQVST